MALRRLVDHGPAKPKLEEGDRDEAWMIKRLSRSKSDHRAVRKRTDAVPDRNIKGSG
jgi:hypothetical protein